ncbi:MAG TPA: hypothetical protein VG247_31225 [Pseudonocardiaceae bacterium]|jgi:hypothetical protein|nr:hypothetical protein [Pseudonocardiaceae bacterium]
MAYVLVTAGLIIVAVLIWRAFAPGRVGVGARRRPMAPDDDPDFLRKLGEQIKRQDDEDSN